MGVGMYGFSSAGTGGRGEGGRGTDAVGGLWLRDGGGRYGGMQAFWKQMLTVINSSPCSPGTLGNHHNTSNDHVHHRRPIDLRHDRHLRNVLPRGARVLRFLMVDIGRHGRRGGMRSRGNSVPNGGIMYHKRASLCHLERSANLMI
jgi:hypothetical protein